MNDDPTGSRVEEAKAPFVHRGPDDDWVHELIAMTRPGVEMNLPRRGLGDRVIPFQFDDFN